MDRAFPGYNPRRAPALSVEHDVAARIDAVPVRYSNPSPILPTVLDEEPNPVTDYLKKVIADAVTAEEGRLFLGAVVAVVAGGLLLKFL